MAIEVTVEQIVTFGGILVDQAGTGKYYRLEVSGDALQIVDLTD